jgi:hypothetical protein
LIIGDGSWWPGLFSFIGGYFGIYVVGWIAMLLTGMVYHISNWRKAKLYSAIPVILFWWFNSIIYIWTNSPSTHVWWRFMISQIPFVYFVSIYFFLNFYITMYSMEDY